VRGRKVNVPGLLPAAQAGKVRWGLCTVHDCVSGGRVVAENGAQTWRAGLLWSLVGFGGRPAASSRTGVSGSD
jgi:hypothetical protein